VGDQGGHSLRILIWLPGGFWPAIGGIESFTATLALDLKAKGHHVFVFAFEANSDYLPYEQCDGIELYRFSSVSVASAREQLLICKKIHSLLKTISPHVLHLQYTASTNLIYYFLLSKHVTMPMMMTTHGLLCTENASFYKQLVDKASRVVCVSHYLSHESLVIAPAIKKTSCIHNAIPLNNECFTPPIFNPPKFLCLGRLTFEKGYDLALQAFEKLIKDYPNSELIIAGDGVERTNLIELAAKLGLSSHVRFTGSLNKEQCIEVLKEASIVLIPSHYESFGLVALEAGLFGRPVIASQVGGLPEIINVRTGLLIDANCSEALYQSMRYLCADPERAVQMGKAAYQHIREKFLSNKMTSSYEALYDILLANEFSVF
jgi:glycosyltransferase involved in cell wall biosynthesis